MFLKTLLAKKECKHFIFNVVICATVTNFVNWRTHNKKFAQVEEHLGMFSVWTFSMGDELYFLMKLTNHGGLKSVKMCNLGELDCLYLLSTSLIKNYLCFSFSFQDFLEFFTGLNMVWFGLLLEFLFNDGWKISQTLHLYILYIHVWMELF